MSASLIVQGVLHAPYFIFIRCGDALTDADILEAFHLQGYHPAQTVPRLGVYAVLADDGEWTLLADCWFYLLWHNKRTRPTIERLTAAFDVFACSVGDSDDSFDFVYYRDGKLARKYVVTDPHYQGGAVTETSANLYPQNPTSSKTLRTD